MQQSIDMKEIRNTIDGVELVNDRMIGNSTRQIDAAINLLFKGFKVEIRDHWKNGTDSNTNRYLFERVLNRLRNEHRLDSLIENNKIKIDKNNLTIELL